MDLWRSNDFTLSVKHSSCMRKIISSFYFVQHRRALINEKKRVKHYKNDINCFLYFVYLYVNCTIMCIFICHSTRSLFRFYFLLFVFLSKTAVRHVVASSVRQRHRHDSHLYIIYFSLLNIFFLSVTFDRIFFIL